MSYPDFDHSLPVLEPSSAQFFADEGTFMASLGVLLVRAGVLASNREVKARSGNMKVKIVCSPASSSTFPIFTTRDLRATYEWWPGDTLSVNELHPDIVVEPLTSSS